MMGTRERILTIRLLEKASRQPAFAALLGIEYAAEGLCQEENEEQQ